MSRPYVHGYDERESVRLQDQARSVVDLFHGDTRYPEGSSILEAGCGTGAQTVTLARNSPGARFTSIDLSKISLEEARNRVAAAGVTNVQFRQEDIFALPSWAESFRIVWQVRTLRRIYYALPFLAVAVVGLLTLGGLYYEEVFNLDWEPPSDAFEDDAFLDVGKIGDFCQHQVVQPFDLGG